MAAPRLDMNTIVLPLVAIGLPAACFLAAACPLLLVRRVRPALLGAGGSTCVGFGATVIGLVASGAVPALGTASRAVADDKTLDYGVCASLGTPPAVTTKCTAALGSTLGNPPVNLLNP